MTRMMIWPVGPRATTHIEEFLSFISRDKPDQPITVILLGAESQLPGLRSLVDAARQNIPEELKKNMSVKSYRLRPLNHTRGAEHAPAKCEEALFRCLATMRRGYYAR